MQVWDRRNPSFLKWNEEEEGRGLGYVLEDRMINEGLERNMPTNVDIVGMTNVTQIEELGGEGGGKVREMLGGPNAGGPRMLAGPECWRAPNAGGPQMLEGEMRGDDNGEWVKLENWRSWWWPLKGMR